MPPANRCPASPWAPSTPAPLSLSSLFMLCMTPYRMEYPWVSLGQLSLLCHLPNSCVPPASSLVEWWRKQKRLWHSVNIAQQLQNHLCVIKILSSTNSKYSPVITSMKIFTSAKTSTWKINFPSNSLIERQCETWGRIYLRKGKVWLGHGWLPAKRLR